VSRSQPFHLAHVTVVHGRYDIRILFKQCASLQRDNVGLVSLLVADGGGNEECEGVRILDVGKASFGRIGRAVAGSAAMWRAIRRGKFDLVHMHDPELLILALLLRARGVRVVFDMHENLPKEVLTKSWISRPFRRCVSAVVRRFQTFACRLVPTVFAETSYAEDFPTAKGGVVVLNYPLVNALVCIARPKRTRFTLGYIGGVSCERGADVVLKALSLLRSEGMDVGAVLVGPLSTDISEFEILRRAVAEGWATTTGRLKPEDGWPLIAECHVGVAILRPSANFVESYPTKLFEYMALGLPVVVSDFPLWRSIVDVAKCGLVVDPTDAGAVAGAVRWLSENPEESRLMAQRGRETVLQRYSWASEFTKLKAFYQVLLAQ